MDSIVCVTAGGVSIYLTAGMTCAQAVQSAKDFLRACVPPRARTAARAAGLLGMVANVGVDRSAAPAYGAAGGAAGGPGGEAERGYGIVVKTLTGKSIPISNVTAAMTVEDLQESILDAEGIRPDDQRLLFSGRQLEEGRTMGDYRITEHCAVHLTFRLRGC
jgi:ubiquitin-large subunit ribosomal protein L40e